VENINPVELLSTVENKNGAGKVVKKQWTFNNKSGFICLVEWSSLHPERLHFSKNKGQEKETVLILPLNFLHEDLVRVIAESYTFIHPADEEDKSC